MWWNILLFVRLLPIVILIVGWNTEELVLTTGDSDHEFSQFTAPWLPITWQNLFSSSIYFSSIVMQHTRFCVYKENNSRSKSTEWFFDISYYYLCSVLICQVASVDLDPQIFTTGRYVEFFDHFTHACGYYDKAKKLASVIFIKTSQKKRTWNKHQKHPRK